MARGKAYSDETRAAVMAALLAGQRVSEVANEFEIPPSTVRSWRASLDAGAKEEVRQRFAAKKQMDLAELIGEYLVEILQTLTAQVRFARSTEYLERLPGSELAVLHGVLADKAFRILSAIEQAGEEEEAAG